MSEEAEDSEKQFEPSQKKLDDARAKGEIPKSTDLTTSAAYGGFLIAGLTMGSAALIGLATALQTLLSQADDFAHIIFNGSPTPIMGGLMWSVSMSTAIWFLAPAAIAILSIIAQNSFVFAPSKLQPKLSRISPISGFKNKFGRQGFFEFFKSFAKLLIYCAVMAIFLNSQRNRIIGSLFLEPKQIAALFCVMIMQLMAIVFVIAIIIGLIDFLWQRAEHMRKHRMTRKEMIDEMKQSEGDPMMKQQRRQRATEIAMNKMLVDVPSADVIIVNPTHYAVALKWDRMSGTAPICVAKGVDEVARKIRELAQENVVPIHSDPPTARALFAGVEIGSEVPPDHYKAVAAAIRFAESIRAMVRR